MRLSVHLDTANFVESTVTKYFLLLHITVYAFLSLGWYMNSAMDQPKKKKKNEVSKNAAAATAQIDPKWNVLTRVCCHTLCHLYICPVHYSSVTHPLEADCTFLIYWKEIIWSLFNKYINKLHKNLGVKAKFPHTL